MAIIKASPDKHPHICPSCGISWDHISGRCDHATDYKCFKCDDSAFYLNMFPARGERLKLVRKPADYSDGPKAFRRLFPMG